MSLLNYKTKLKSGSKGTSIIRLSVLVVAMDDRGDKNTYVCQTILRKDLKNHRRDLLNVGDQLIAKTELVDHCINEDHLLDFGAADVVFTAEGDKCKICINQ